MVYVKVVNRSISPDQTGAQVTCADVAGMHRFISQIDSMLWISFTTR